MLTVSEAIRQRRSIRSFKSDPVPAEVIRQMLEAARLAPSGGNRQPWRFIVITDTTEKTVLREIYMNQAFIEQAPVVFVCCTDLSAYADVPEPWAGVGAGSPLTLAVANTFIAVEHMALTATALGLGTCWIGGLGNERLVETFLDLPENIVVAALLLAGYPAAVPPSPHSRLPLSEVMLRPLSIPGE